MISTVRAAWGLLDNRMRFQAGSLVFFSPHTVHGSQPNRSDEPRRALVITYQPAGEPMFKLEGTRNAGPARAA